MGNVQDTMGNGKLLRNDIEQCSMRNAGDPPELRQAFMDRDVILSLNVDLSHD